MNIGYERREKGVRKGHATLRPLKILFQNPTYFLYPSKEPMNKVS